MDGMARMEGEGGVDAVIAVLCIASGLTDWIINNFGFNFLLLNYPRFDVSYP